VSSGETNFFSSNDIFWLSYIIHIVNDNFFDLIFLKILYIIHESKTTCSYFDIDMCQNCQKNQTTYNLQYKIVFFIQKNK